jgi:hypothetical protein
MTKLIASLAALIASLALAWIAWHGVTIKVWSPQISLDHSGEIYQHLQSH